MAQIEAAAPRAELAQVQSQRAGRGGRIGDEIAEMAGAVVEWTREARVSTRVARVDLERRVDLVADIDLVAVATARRSRRVLADIRINDGLGLQIERACKQGHLIVIAEG